MNRIWVVIPALDEERSIGHVIEALPPSVSSRVVVVDNGSTDRTAEMAASRGATVVREDRRGYGQACLTGLDVLRAKGVDGEDIVVFVDADYSDDPSELTSLVQPIEKGEADFVVGSRVLGHREPGALLPQARVGNWLAGHLMYWMTGVRFTDLGPFRAIIWSKLESLRMRDTAFGWTVEMQLKAAAAGLRCAEVPVSYRKRVGASKITGTLKGTILASVTILSILARFALRGRLDA